MILPEIRPVAAAAAAASPDHAVDAPPLTALLVAVVLVAFIVLPIAYHACRRLSGAVRSAPGKAPASGRRRGARAEKRRARLAAAAVRYEAAGELQKAAALHLRSGGSLRAAGIYLRTDKHLKAAKIFRVEGDHLRAAQALERHGDRAAAACEYSAAGNHARAARLLEEERMYADAAAAYHPLLGDARVTRRNAAQHTRYATLLALAGDLGRAADVYRRVLAAVPGHLRAASGLQSLMTWTSADHGTTQGSEPIPIAAEDLDLEYLEAEGADRRSEAD